MGYVGIYGGFVVLILVGDVVSGVVEMEVEVRVL